MLTERDTVNADGSLNWRAIRNIATLRALAELDAEIVNRVYGPVLRLPAGISQDNVREWKAKLAAKALAENPKLDTTPYLKIYRTEMRRALAAARAIRHGMGLRQRLVRADVPRINSIRLVDQLIGSLEIEMERAS